jgi:PAS domain S-box-containing protein
MMKKIKQLEKENEELRIRLEEAEDSLRAIKAGEVDALVVSGPEGEQVFTLKDANRPYRMIFEEMEEGAVTLTETGLILYSNKQFAAMVNTPLSKLIGSSIYTYLVRSQRAILEGLLSRVYKKVRKGEILFGKYPRNRKHALVSFRPLRIDSEPLFIGVITDITQLKLAEEDSIRLAAAIEQAFNSVVISDLKGNILYANPACERLTGYDSRAIKEQTLNMFGNHNGRKLIHFIREALKKEDV